jgi:hypothetical protein
MKIICNTKQEPTTALLSKIRYAGRPALRAEFGPERPSRLFGWLRKTAVIDDVDELIESRLSRARPCRP